MDGQTNEWTENLPILQDRCPSYPQENQKKSHSKTKVEQGKGTAEHLMPLGKSILGILGILGIRYIRYIR